MGLADQPIGEAFFAAPAMQIPTRFDVQGHRGARGLRPENTLSGFELAFDLGVTSIETDLHLTRDGVPVLFHDAAITGNLCSPSPTAPRPISSLTLAELRGFRVERNPDPRRFPHQSAEIGPCTGLFAARQGVDPLGILPLFDLFAFTADYAGTLGKDAGKTPAQQDQAKRVFLDLELKRVPFLPHIIGDTFGVLERRVLDAAEQAGMLERIRVRSFDHRSVSLIAQMQPGVRTAVLIANTAPVRPGDLLEASGAQMYCPDYRFVDAAVVRQVHSLAKLIVPWTVNEPGEWRQLVDWGVDGITTDYPDRLLHWLKATSRQTEMPTA
jgi:glycerophosphoryl diester phosphodiesterase